MPFLTATVQSEAMQLDLLQICMRLLCAMLVGMVIGTEREYTHRPAGMRTHILVALGACVVSIVGEMLFTQYNALGATPDPARLSAQVITGVGMGAALEFGIEIVAALKGREAADKLFAAVLAK